MSKPSAFLRSDSPWLAVGLNILSSAIIAVIAYTRRRISTTLGKRSPRLAFVPVIAVGVIWLASSISSLILAHSDTAPFYAVLLLFLIPTSLLLWLIWYEFDRFWAIGLRGADKHIRTGIDYGAALSLCREQLAFLGTGAAKLTSNPSFQGALMRCRPDEPIRFLLMRPDALNLERAARRAGRDRAEYQGIVLESLRTLASLRNNRDLRIEVRFYAGESAFRLMFIDDALCLASYNVYGHRDPSDFPQIHIMSRADVTESFYYAFQRHFDLIWDASKEWDFQSYL